LRASCTRRLEAGTVEAFVARRAWRQRPARGSLLCERASRRTQNDIVRGAHFGQTRRCCAPTHRGAENLENISNNVCAFPI
jgi:hypothetical protein